MQTSEQPALRWGTSTDTGRVRTENEDNFVAESAVFGVADGMGGHLAGEVASEIASTILRDRLIGGASHADVVVAAVVEANAAIFSSAHSHAEQRGMGTTLTALVILRNDEHPHRLAVVNVGDSRIYRLRNGRLRRTTTDHSYVQELVATGHISEQEARTHPRRNIVTRALGIEPNVRVDTWVLPMVRGDRFVLCSDGLVDEVDDDEIAEIVNSSDDPQVVADALVASANEHGGRDNVTVVVVDLMEGEDPPAPEDDLDLEPGWADDDDDETGGNTRLIEADRWPSGDSDHTTAMKSQEMQTQQVPAIAADEVAHSSAKKRRLTPGLFLFFLALAAIATVTVVLVLVAANKDDETPATTTTVESTTTSSSSTTSTTSTTIASTTTGPESSIAVP